MARYIKKGLISDDIKDITEIDHTIFLIKYLRDNFLNPDGNIGDQYLLKMVENQELSQPKIEKYLNEYLASIHRSAQAHENQSTDESRESRESQEKQLKLPGVKQNNDPQQREISLLDYIDQSFYLEQLKRISLNYKSKQHLTLPLPKSFIRPHIEDETKPSFEFGKLNEQAKTLISQIFPSEKPCSSLLKY
jgi:hypothetical protein